MKKQIVQVLLVGALMTSITAATEIPVAPLGAEDIETETQIEEIKTEYTVLTEESEEDEGSYLAEVEANEDDMVTGSIDAVYELSTNESTVGVINASSDMTETTEENSVVEIENIEEFEGYISGTKVNVRENASVESDILFTLDLNTQVTYIKYNDEWVQICHKEEIGFVSAKYISDKKVKKSKSLSCPQAYTCSKFKKLGRVYYGNYSYTWYSQRVLPGGGLNIPGRHLNNDGVVCDKDGYAVIACDFLPKGTVIDTPIGLKGKVYDCGAGANNCDIYVSW